MKLRTALAWLLSAAVATSALPYAEATTRSVEQAYPDGSYSAILSDAGTRWRLFDVSGAVSAVDVQGCGTPFRIPPGLWLLSRDRSGGVQLLAPSATVLPPGHRGIIEVRACGEANSSQTLQLPAALIATLESHASTILVQR
jgi:hypothetical protein